MIKDLPTGMVLGGRVKVHLQVGQPALQCLLDQADGEVALVMEEVLFIINASSRASEGSTDRWPWMAHELRHCSQYGAAGREGAFLRIDFAQVARQVIATRSFAVHDQLGLEVNAASIRSARPGSGSRANRGGGRSKLFLGG